MEWDTANDEDEIIEEIIRQLEIEDPIHQFSDISVPMNHETALTHTELEEKLVAHFTYVIRNRGLNWVR